MAPLGVITASCRGNTLDYSKNRGYKNPKRMEVNGSLRVRSFASSRGGEELTEKQKHSRATVVRGVTDIMSAICIQAREEAVSTWSVKQLEAEGAKVKGLSGEEDTTVEWSTMPDTETRNVQCVAKPLAGLRVQIESGKDDIQGGGQQQCYHTY